jgi:hypothetical protein
MLSTLGFVTFKTEKGSNPQEKDGVKELDRKIQI